MKAPLRRSLTAVALLLALLAPALAQDQGNTLVQARLTSEFGCVVPDREETLAVVLEVAPGWHVYWKNPGDIGMPTTVTLDLPPGLQAGEVRWPAPKRFVHEGSASYGYEGRVVLLVPLRAASDLPPERGVTVKCRVEWLVCDPNGCFPGGANVEVRLHVSSGAAAPLPTADGSDIAKARRLLPTEAPPDLRVTWSKSAPTLTLEAPGASALTFFPHLPDDGPPEDMAARGHADGPRLEVVYPARVAGLPVTGVLAIARGGETTYHEVATTAPR